MFKNFVVKLESHCDLIFDPLAHAGSDPGLILLNIRICYNAIIFLISNVSALWLLRNESLKKTWT